MLKSILNINTYTLSELRLFSNATTQRIVEKINNFRCIDSNPSNHSLDNVGQFYLLPKEDEEALFTHGGLPTTFKTQCKTFSESCIMIRKPAIDIINCLKKVDYKQPPCKFVLYGKKGSGRSLSVAHILHYGFKSGFLIMHVPWVGNWMRRYKETSPSIIDEGLIDLNMDAAIWLAHFKNQNSHLLKNEHFKLSQEHIWNKREKATKGSPLTEIIDFGINRIKYASLCVNILAEEIKKISINGFCKTLVVVDGFNAFFYPNTRIYTDQKQIVHPHQVTLTKPFLSLSKFDWNNAAIVLTVDEIATGDQECPSYLPKYLLGMDGFTHLDPFVPIPVENYTEKELLSCIEYYRDRKWIQQDYPGVEEELAFISNSNPYKLLEVTAPL